MNIQTIKLTDFQNIYALWKKAGLSLVYKEKEEREFMLMIKHNPTSCFAAIENNEIIGTVLGTFNGRRAWIYHLAIHPNWQKRGYGSLLLQHVETKLKEKQATKILLGVNLSNPETTQFYEKNGYHVINDAILMAKDI